MAATPQEWLAVLASRLDARQPQIAKLRSYSNGNPPLPEMGKNLRAAWVRFQKKARTNFGGLILESLAERIVPNGVVVGTNRELTDRARRVWRDNRLDAVFADAILDMLDVSVGYVVVGKGSNGRAVVTSEKPEMMIASVDPLRQWVTRAALKVWRDPDDGFDYASVWLPGSRQLFRRPSLKDGRPLHTASGEWSTWGQPEEYEGDPPIIVLENRGGQGEIEPHTDLIDRIYEGILHRLVTVSMQAFRQRAVKGDLPDADPDGNAIDYAKVFEPAPGAMWELPDGVDVWESQQTDVRPLLDATTEDRKELCAVTRTPVSTLIPDSTNQSAEGAAAAREGQVFKARDRIRRIKAPLEGVLLTALRVEGVDPTETVEVGFEPPAMVSQSEKYAAAVQAKAAGESWKSIAKNILGYSPEQIQQDALDRAEEQLTLMTLAPQQPGVTVGGTGPAA